MEISKKMKHIFGAIFFLLFGLFLLAGLLGTNDSNWGEITQADLVNIDGHLFQNPKIGEIGKGNEQQLEIRLKEYPEIRFNNFGIMFDNTLSQKVLDSLKEGDFVILKVLKYDYEAKLTKIKARNFLEKFADPSDLISMYGIVKNTSDFVAFKSLQSDLSSHVPTGRIVGWFAAIGFLIAGIAKLLRQ